MVNILLPIMSLTQNKKMQNNSVTDYNTILKNFAEICSKTEKCVSQALEYAKKKGLDNLQAKQMANYLVENNYINHQRFAEAFAADKSKFSKWGLIKISNALKLKGIEQKYISNALQLIPCEKMESMAVEQIEKKAAKIKYKDYNDLKIKLLRFCFSRGYDIEKSKIKIDAIIKQLKEG